MMIEIASEAYSDSDKGHKIGAEGGTNEINNTHQ